MISERDWMPWAPRNSIVYEYAEEAAAEAPKDPPILVPGKNEQPASLRKEMAPESAKPAQYWENKALD